MRKKVAAAQSDLEAAHKRNHEVQARLDVAEASRNRLANSVNEREHKLAQACVLRLSATWWFRWPSLLLLCCRVRVRVCHGPASKSWCPCARNWRRVPPTHACTSSRHGARRWSASSATPRPPPSSCGASCKPHGAARSETWRPWASSGSGSAATQRWRWRGRWNDARQTRGGSRRRRRRPGLTARSARPLAAPTTLRRRALRPLVWLAAVAAVV